MTVTMSHHCKHHLKLSVIFLLCLIVGGGIHGVGASEDGAITVVDQPEDSIDDAVVESVEPIEVSDEVFYPTDQWQHVKPGQAVPKGLHIRLNLETGEREAKLQDEDIEKMKFWNKEGKQGMLNTQAKSFTREELKNAMKQFRTETFTDKASLEQMESAKKKFRSYETLKKDLEQMEMAVKTDREIIIELVAALEADQLTDNLTDEEMSNILSSLEYYVHQIDNAVLFGDLGGMAILYKALNSTHNGVRKEAAGVLGAAVQSNPKAQIAAVDRGLLPILLRLLSLDQSKELQKTYLFAVSSLIRHFPYAQSQFLQLGGLSVLSDIFQQNDGLRVKTVTLLHDLLLEKESAMRLGDSEHDVVKKKQYEAIPLVESLVTRGWCDLIPHLLQPSAHDTNEKTLHAMTDLSKHCLLNFRTSVPTLQSLHTQYTQLSVKEQTDDPSDDYYYTSIVSYIDNLLLVLQHKEEL